MRIEINELKSFFNNKSVLIVGGAPRKHRSTNYDIIVRLNNYEREGASTRTDVYYSHFGRSIFADSDILIGDGVKYIMCKYPRCDFVEHTGGDIREGYSGSFGWVYQFRFHWWKIPYYIPSLKNFKKNYAYVNRIPTTGLSAILDISRLGIKELHITGFDNFKTHLHHGQPWKPGDGNHDIQKERDVMKQLEKEGLFKWHK